jgi:hypothetical protein
MSNQSAPSRVHYFSNQYLRLNEFADEQAYQVALRRRHNIGHHSWGIVVGLELVLENGIVVVRPGMAIDGYGRELMLPATRQIPTGEFKRLGSNRLDVWLYYDSAAGAAAPSGYLACGNDKSNTHYRTDETPRLVLERAGVSRVDSRRPKGVAPAILDSPAQLETPSDPLVVWPVYLGRLTQVPEEQDPQKQFLIDASDRPYAGVVAEVIDHPANATRVEIGKVSQQDDQRQVGETTYVYKSTGDRAFAVFVPPQDDPGSQNVSLEPRFEIDTDGKNYLRGAATVRGNLQMAGGAVQFTQQSQVDDTVSRSAPSLYRASGTFGDELRIDLGDLLTQSRVFVIGFTADDGSFRPSMKLEYKRPDNKDPQPLLTIYGDLKMEGLLNSPDVLERPLSSQTLQALLSSFQAGTIVAGGR